MKNRQTKSKFRSRSKDMDQDLECCHRMCTECDLSCDWLRINFQGTKQNLGALNTFEGNKQTIMGFLVRNIQRQFSAAKFCV